MAETKAERIARIRVEHGDLCTPKDCETALLLSQMDDLQLEVNYLRAEKTILAEQLAHTLQAEPKIKAAAFREAAEIARGEAEDTGTAERIAAMLEAKAAEPEQR